MIEVSYLVSEPLLTLNPNAINALIASLMGSLSLYRIRAGKV